MIGRDIDLTEGLDFGKDSKSLPVMVSKNELLKDKKERDSRLKASDITTNNSFNIEYYSDNIITSYTISLSQNDMYGDSVIPVIPDITTCTYSIDNSYLASAHTSTVSNHYTGSSSNWYDATRIDNYYDNSLSCNFAFLSNNTICLYGYNNDLSSKVSTLIAKDKDMELFTHISASLKDRDHKEKLRRLSGDIKRLFWKEKEYFDKDSEYYIKDTMLKGNPERHKDLDNRIKSPWLRNMKRWNRDDYLEELKEDVDYMKYLTSNWYHAHRSNLEGGSIND